MSCGVCLDLAHMVSDVTLAKAVGCLQNKSAVGILQGKSSTTQSLCCLEEYIFHALHLPGASRRVIKSSCMLQRCAWHAGSLHWSLIGEAGPSCMQHGEASLQRLGVPGGIPAPAGQLLPFPSSAQSVQGAQPGAAAGAPLYAQAYSHLAAPSQLQLPQHSTGAAELQAAPPAHLHGVMLSSQANSAAQQPAPALYQNNAGVRTPAMGAASNAMTEAVPFSQAHAQPSALYASQHPPAPHADLQAAGARIGQHHAQQRQHFSSGAQLQQQYSSSAAAEHDAPAPQRPHLKSEDASSDRPPHDNHRAQDLPRCCHFADLVQA